MTVDELSEHEEEIKEFWLENRDLKKVAEHFGFAWGGKEWMWLVSHYRTWRNEIIEEEATQRASTLTDEEANRLLELSRKRAIIMLSEILKHYEENPRQLKNVDIKEVSRLYSIIKSAEEQAKRTEIALHKEKRETVKDFLPYQRLTPEQLEVLKQKLGNGINQLIQPKSEST
jgi:hypothetical protein